MAASNLNRVVLTANLTKDPDLRSTPGGTSVCFLRGVGASTRPAALAAIAGLIGESAGRRLRAGTIGRQRVFHRLATAKQHPSSRAPLRSRHA